jgi:hypothetical protein
MSDKSDRLQELSLRFARSATKHGISKKSIRYAIAHCGLVFGEGPPAEDAEVLDRRLVCLGDDASGRALEVIAVEGNKDDLIVIHAMALRKKYLGKYEEAKQWRR